VSCDFAQGHSKKICIAKYFFFILHAKVQKQFLSISISFQRNKPCVLQHLALGQFHLTIFKQKFPIYKHTFNGFFEQNIFPRFTQIRQTTIAKWNELVIIN
jgi:hypothetical protein